MVHWGYLKGIPFKIEANLKRMLMVPFGNIRGFPSKSKRIQRGNLREPIGKLKEFELSSNWRDSLQFPKGVLKFLIKFFSILGKSDMHSNDILKMSIQIVFNFLRLLMVSLRLPLWILIDLEGKPLYIQRGPSAFSSVLEKSDLLL